VYVFSAPQGALQEQGNLLSGGEQQMLCVARAMMTNPDFLIMDEASEDLLLIVREIGERSGAEKDGLSVLLARSRTCLSLRVSDYVYVVSKGEIVLQCTPEELRNSNEMQNRYLGVEV
jgi:branched-chain amino acid transport system ATP-binding protein